MNVFIEVYVFEYKLFFKRLRRFNYIIVFIGSFCGCCKLCCVIKLVSVWYIVDF